MATPTRSQAVSTPKPHLSTPTSGRLMASPRPGTANASNRPLAHKSPAVKTPASLHGHNYHVSVSSQPSSTPLNSTALHDDLLALNSPAAALIASLGPTGLTPLGNATDGLGISANGQGPPGRVGVVSFTPDLERSQRAHWVANLLKTRAAGRGVTREGVERIAQLQGFNTLWEDDNLTIAGNAVDLEVSFERLNRQVVKDVSFKLITSETEEPQLQEAGTAILKNNLAASPSEHVNAPWGDLSRFESNLQYLQQVDQIEGGAQCFNAVNGLYDAFQKIWNSEKHKLGWRATEHHLRRGAIGRPSIDRSPKLGVSLDYWTRRQELPPPSIDVDHTDGTLAMNLEDLYVAQISCGPGPPSTLLPQRWVSDQVLSEQTQAESILEAESDTWRPDWMDPASGPDDPNALPKTGLDDIDIEKPAELLSPMLNMHFTCSLFPEIYLPLNAVAGLNVSLSMVDLDQDMTTTYQQALNNCLDKDRSIITGAIQERRWSRALPTPTAADGGALRYHSYALHSSQNGVPLWCAPIKLIKFTHPRQLANALPLLRQYALLWDILRSLVDFGHKQETEPVGDHVTGSKALDFRTRPLKRSNVKRTNSRLGDSDGLDAQMAAKEGLPIDVSLDIISDPSRARLDVFIPLSGVQAKGSKKPFIFLSFDVCSGGTIEIKTIQGVQGSGPGDSDLSLKVSRILSVTEDIGVVAEWLLEKIAPQA